jgi:dihydrofolate reductase
MKVIGIVTCTKFGGMAQGNLLPWPELYFGLDNFKLFVGDSPVLVGNATYKNMYQIKHLDPTRKYFIYTNQSPSTTTMTNTVSGDPVDVISKIAEDETIETLFIAGGSKVFETFYNVIDEWIITILEEHQLQFDKVIPLEKIKTDWPVSKELTSGVDHYQHFAVMKYSKE